MKKEGLLITTIGEIDCVQSWICENRNYDIALIYYPEYISEETKDFLYQSADYVFFESGFKYTVIQKILKENPNLMTYDFYWMPDHDVKFKRGNVNLLFSIMKEYGLAMAQPSLVNKNRSWKILVHKWPYVLRYINLVEVMCPAFTKKSLEKALKSFTWSKSGWGLGLLWGKLVEGDKAVIDRLLVEHTKKMDVEGGSLYKMLLETTGKRPEEERDELVNKYALDTDIYHIKKIPREGFIYSVFNW